MAESIIPTTDSLLYFHAPGSYTYTSFQAFGYVSTSSYLYFEIPMAKLLPSGITITIDSLKMATSGIAGSVDTNLTTSKELVGATFGSDPVLHYDVAAARYAAGRLMQVRVHKLNASNASVAFSNYSKAKAPMYVYGDITFTLAIASS